MAKKRIKCGKKLGKRAKKGKVQRVTKVVNGQVWTFKKPKVKVIPIGLDVKVFKFLGFCKCGSQVGSGDLESKLIYKCPECGRRERKSKLDKNRGGGEKPLSRKEYMEATINSEHLEAPYIASEDVPPEILKKFEEDD